jgi:hypothetical protein
MAILRHLEAELLHVQTTCDCALVQQANAPCLGRHVSISLDLIVRSASLSALGSAVVIAQQALRHVAVLCDLPNAERAVCVTADVAACPLPGHTVRTLCLPPFICEYVSMLHGSSARVRCRFTCSAPELMGQLRLQVG